MTSFTLGDIPDMTGRTVVVTGANSGIGRATAAALAERGARVVLAVRDERKGRAAAAAMAGHTEVRRLDLADLASVRAFARDFTDPLDLLVNNAGVTVPSLARTADGFERQFGTNHLGHFALTNLLLPRLRGRVVTVSSLAHLMGSIDFADLNWHRRGYRAYPAYAQSKLANLLFADELSRRLAAAASPVVSTAAHPGIAATNLVNEAGGRTLRFRLEKALMGAVAHSARAGALPTLCAAVAEVPSGGYIGPRRLMGMRGAPAPARRAASARDADTARRLWRVSEELTGTAFPL
ncbi:SDR family NAD(P)-dependent oxidoreductase [Streptomonospora sp. S1-112]|uniref:SDR family NAD(P)-dependent oxidoreductase n=1 Tax=Streptomonospora mangrovi TaxID=2883123 RepID=A0A9X3NJQ9_9ACTN|nr:oxidoreductase [Streptomonospora mangrovi]MDA0563388.1 SDR family NAD(P)-dependent oxidoreductase [Streptomonospora mangrovi]